MPFLFKKYELRYVRHFCKLNVFTSLKMYVITNLQSFCLVTNYRVCDCQRSPNHQLAIFLVHVMPVICISATHWSLRMPWRKPAAIFPTNRTILTWDRRTFLSQTRSSFSEKKKLDQSNEVPERGPSDSRPFDKLESEIEACFYWQQIHVLKTGRPVYLDFHSV